MKIEYRLSVSKNQLKIINAALEEYFRLRLGQFWTLIDDWAATGLDLRPVQPPATKNSQDWKLFLERRDMLDDLLRVAYRWVAGNNNKKSEYEMMAYEIFQVIRHQLWIDDGGETKMPYAVDGHPYLAQTDEPMPKIERINTDDIQREIGKGTA